ncbi:hypothetical protein EMIHUDRAFT_223092 [Emiliania huxleyi CCMP1516]|uniref:Palmitoyltransferase n=2 Tax=Emiliania huxleyi TaxID=2903 RepID=A0A0D3KWS0_EMIH1|nr:hypothetical protein EMIHUDRAFT_206881 [Emiliania huxleyi CCMP1516]XP_005792634.1 hypothetical protein EMIHUDRAFT_223092 [Emiliania huxleyi CCMP1516]EOD23905.1 hypothetical protein EMIHUDRAFT_206881 [Emiliania huxleyi CCMP1516]EOD40205.1 hypothetical protein EMIHUDRAFT_223092 [Emiliania huxleyi CCMP1516]|eukprot:XP_005776334.1 hypothetical protein EMIHUDRAFT_206881 [Emiliania huxleyi CCMP1516]
MKRVVNCRCIQRVVLSAIGWIDWAFSLLLRVVGPVLVVLANSLIALVSVQWIFGLAPVYVTAPYGVVASGLVHAFGIYLLLNILFNYWGCLLTRPGFPGDHLAAVEAAAERATRDSTVPRVRFCKRCRVPKPARTHHCSVCNRCVLKMDHHCPWVNNCVGFFNYRYFLLFLLHLAAGCVFVMCTCLLGHLQGHDLLSARNSSVLFVAVLCALGIFLFWHVYLVLTNQTTIEFYSNRMDAMEARREGRTFRNQYSLGYRANAEQVFGPRTRSYLGWTLVSRTRPPGDGVDWPTHPREALHHV